MIRIAAVSDLHFTLDKRGQLATRFADVSERADILLLPGDLTDNGTPEEAHAFAAEFERVSIPILAVLGNHDFAARSTNDLISILGSYGIKVLDGDSAQFRVGDETVGIAGVRGFRGGFGEEMLDEVTEPETEMWVNSAKREAEKLEATLRALETRYRVAMTHYAPIRATIEGEHPETYPFYGSSRLCEAVERAGADLFVHGHSHKGTHTGRTPSGIPVYNVAAKVIDVPYVVLELSK
jgi:Icc-related predicted phosphoesterase